MWNSFEEGFVEFTKSEKCNGLWCFFYVQRPCVSKCNINWNWKFSGLCSWLILKNSWKTICSKGCGPWTCSWQVGDTSDWAASHTATQNPYKIKVHLALEKPEKNNHDVDEVEASILRNRNTLLTSMQKSQEPVRRCKLMQQDVTYSSQIFCLAARKEGLFTLFMRFARGLKSLCLWAAWTRL